MLKDRIEQLIEKVCKGVYERDEQIKLVLLAAMAGESVFLIGAPGVAKSLIARRLKHAFQDGKSFEYLMNRFSTPDEIFGPVAISKLKSDQYERVIEGYLPWANVVFLDEIWKASPSIQNTLLTIINEKVYRNGSGEKKVPLRLLISASNELPEKNAGLEALWDRFLIRCFVKNIQDSKRFDQMITDTNPCYENHIDPALKITEEEYDKWSKKIDRVNVSGEVLNIIRVIRAYIQEYNDKQTNPGEKIAVSDRRWKKIIRILRASAFLNDRKSVDLMDCFLIAHCIWNKPDQIPAVKELVAESVKKYGYSMSLDTSAIKDEIRKFDAEVKKETTKWEPCKETEKRLIDGKYYKIPNFKHSGCNLILQSDFHSLKRAGTEIELFSRRARGYSQKYVCAKNGANSIRIKPGYTNYRKYKLQTREVDKIKTVTHKPDAAQYKIWGEKTRQLLGTVRRIIKQFEQHTRKHMVSTVHNIFVDRELNQIVLANIQATKDQLNNLKLDIERIKHDYDSI